MFSRFWGYCLSTISFHQAQHWFCLAPKAELHGMITLPSIEKALETPVGVPNYSIVTRSPVRAEDIAHH